MMHINHVWILPNYQEKHGTTLYDIWKMHQPQRLGTYATLKDARADYPDAAFMVDKESLLRLCHLAPTAVQMDTRDLETAIRKLVDFAWEMVQS